ncbi:MAG: SurA N-terminal domain-containing protein [Pseudomonadales bacterium]|nr:SurA N-terminal domain-containing protein [Pseudomonadales bacterium]
MDAFRNLLKGWFGKCLLVLFILPFAFFGIEGLFQAGGRGNTEVVVNGVEITKPEIDRAAELQRRNLVQRMGGNIDPSFISMEMVRPSAIEYLIRKTLLGQAVEHEGLFVAQENAKSFVRAMPQFQDETGQFSQTRLEQLLVQAGYTGTGFFAEVREDLLVKQLQSGISASAFTIPSELKSLVVLDKQKRDISTLEVKAADYRDQVEVSDDDIQIHYDANSSSYQTPEKAKVEYLHLSLANFTSEEPISDEDVQAAFEKILAAEADKERRRAKHLLVEVGGDLSEQEALDKIKEAQAEIEQGVSFDKVVEKYSDDIATSKLGGDLGFAGRGVYDSSFEDALYALEVGQTSDIVKTEFGYHIIRLAEIDKKELPTFENEKAGIIETLKQDRSRDALAIAIEDLNQKAFEHPDTLEDAAEGVRGAEIKTSDWITRVGAAGPLNDPKVMAKIFDPEFIEDRLNSEVIELDNDEIVLVRVMDYQAKSVKPLEEVKAQVKNAVISKKSKEKASEVANGLLAKLATGSSADAVATEISKEWTVKAGVARQSTELGREVVQKAFELPAPTESASYDKVQLPSGDQVIVAVSKVEAGVYELSEQEEKQMQQVVQSRYGQYDFNNYIETLRESSQIENKQI